MKPLSGPHWLGVLFAVSILVFFSRLLAEPMESGAALLEKLSEASETKGIQVGVIADTQKDGTTPKYELVTLRQKKDLSAYDALQATSYSKAYEPQYREPPMVMLRSLDGVDATKGEDGKRQSWAFFIGNPKTKTWKVAPTGIAGHEVEDGGLIGFSLTSWSSQKGKYMPKNDPRF